MTQMAQMSSGKESAESAKSAVDFRFPGNQVVGYDLAGFFQRHVRRLQTEVSRVLEVLLSVE